MVTNINTLAQMATQFIEKALIDRSYEYHRRLGDGCERMAYSIGEGLVLKIRKDFFINGEEEDLTHEDIDLKFDISEEWQTEKEIEIWEELSEEEKSLFNPILYHSKYKGVSFTVSPYVDIINETEWFDSNLPERNVAFENIALLQNVAEKYDLDLYDMTENFSNAGINKEGKLVITDFGLMSY